MNRQTTVILIVCAIFGCRNNNTAPESLIVKQSNSLEQKIESFEPEIEPQFKNETIFKRTIEEESSSDQSQIEKDIDQMLLGMRFKFTIFPHLDRITEHGEQTVPILINKYNEIDENKRWALVACLCRLPTPESRKFLINVASKYIDRASTSYIISHYPIQYDDEIVDILIKLLFIDKYRFDANDQLRKMIFRNPSIVGKLIDALVDDISAWQINFWLYDILNFVSGYGNEWTFRINLKNPNQFWRDWWDRNQHKEIFEWLTESLYRENGSRRSQALSSLSILCDKRSIPHLLNALDDNEDNVKYEAVIGLKMIEGNYPPSGYLYETFKSEKEQLVTEFKERYAKKSESKPAKK